MVEDLDDLLTIDHFFNETFCAANCLLLFHEVLCGLSTDDLCNHDGYDRTGNNNQCHRNTVVQHDAENCCDRHKGNHELWEALGNHLSQRIRIVCVMGHDITMFMGIKVADWKRLHMRKHLLTQLVQ